MHTITGPKANVKNGPILWIFDGAYAYLDNFYHAPIKVPGLGWCDTVEHAFQAAKAADPLDREQIHLAPGPGYAKMRGRSKELKMIPTWDAVKFGVMRTALELKFSSYPKLLKGLRSTGDRLIEEGNVWDDRVWGCVDREGQNWLGRMLMDIRDNGFKVVK